MKYLYENPMTRMKKSLLGIDKSVRSFAILTAENPMGEKYTKSQNIERQESLKQYLKRGIFQYIFIKGKYGNLENPFLILNININEAIEIGRIYNQESIIFANNYFDYVEFQYWEQKGNGDFKLLDTSDYFSTLDNPVDFYSYKRDWKFNIPLSIFESINTYGNRYMKGLSEDIKKEINAIWTSIIEEDKTLSHYYRLRGKCQYLHRKSPMYLVNKTVESRSSFQAYWIKYNQVYEVDTKHINMVIKNPEMFGLTIEEIRAIYKKYNEKIGQEGKAREEIIKLVAKNGWLRVRHYAIPKDYWTIQFDSHRKRKKNIDAFIDYALENLNMNINDELSLLGYEDNFQKTYAFSDGGISIYLMERVKKELSSLLS